MSSSRFSDGILFPRISTAFIDGTARSVRHRQQQCHRLQRALVENRILITDALQNDNGYSETEAWLEYGLTLLELRQNYNTLNVDAEQSSARAVKDGAHGLQRMHVVGIVYIIPSRSKSSLYNVVSPLGAAIAAGSCVIVESSNPTSGLTSVLQATLLKALSKDTFAISEKTPPESFLSRCVVVQQNDLNSETLENLRPAKRLIISASLTPSFCFVDRTADLKLAAQNILEAIFAFKGSSPYAPKVVFVHEAVKEPFCAYLEEFAGAVSAFSSANKRTVTTEEGAHNALSPKAADSIPGKDIIASSSHFTALNLASTRSLDDAIRTAEKVIGDPFQTASGAFIFASPAEANYLANSLNADVTCVNQFPPELLVGPKWPKSIKRNIQDTSMPLNRYPRGLFEEEQAVIFGSSPLSRLLRDEKRIASKTSSTFARVEQWVEDLQLPLKITGQRLGRRVDFFEAALLTSFCTMVLPALVCLGLVGRAVFGKMSGG